ncbi:DNA polymerase III subunit alpha [Pseudoroseomonas wenyumeiae]|uniref:DNA polymerase III subunit alpha n=1 Tax=Teichococcus wenyumeiae TaxID=2478470 RepID=A0A3A9J8G4_9PROT|nr:DNA polymerase III subunit alpha [Pseudoroseomonas wenyumeiae]RKK03567.1 DNA polymerase III subunit alpha [Pseudoroseomonas wenyumeiae]RMI25731.1 DNA polymerase III subunit alpha [Pseudoroseomonas wenyumeiae]
MSGSFVHLHTHSAYSLAEGAIKADKLAVLAKEAGMPALALTDTANMFGALEFSNYCSGKGVQPIIGCQLNLTRAATDDRPEQARLLPDPLVVLAMNAQGLENVQRLSSHGFLRDDPSGKPTITLDLLRSHSEGVFLLTGGTAGPLGRLLSEGRKEAAAHLLDALKESFSDRLAVELTRHGLPVERGLDPAMLALADAAGLPVVATNDVYFAKPEMYEAHDALLCIAEGRTLAEPDRRRLTAEHYFKSAAAMRKLFADLPEACDNTLAIARRCHIMAENRKPELPICPKVQPGMTEAETVRDMARRGLEARLDAQGTTERKVYHDRLEFELNVIEKMGFSGYFLIVADFIQWAKQQGIPVGPGRGSGAGSVAAWALLITDLDPLRFGLLFERFLNPERVSMPDFDIDFCQDRRDEVIQYVRREYGEDRVAQIITFGRLQAKAVVRDVGRVMGMPYGQVNRIAELIPFNPAKPVTLQQALDGEPRLQDMRADETVDRLMETALVLEGLYRNASTHAAGVVIGRKPLIDIVALYRDPRSDMLVTQYSMKYVENASLVKFDFLGLKTLTVLQRAVEILAEQGHEVDLTRIPLDDKKTYDMLARGDSAGVFQFEGQGMRDCLRMMRPDRFEDLIAAVSLYRPGPMANIPAYCARKHGEAWEPVHPAMRHLVEETYGILVYQEQVMQISQDVAGYSLGGADLLRRAMGKKIRSEMEAQRKIFVDGAVKNGVPEGKAGEIFDLMEKFAEYGFNKSHAAAYALVAYHTAYLKANHPVAFIAASMTFDMDKTEKLANHMQEASRLGIKVLPPDVNRSAADFRVEKDAEGNECIRFALAAVKRVGLQAMKDLVAARDRPFESVADFAGRVDPKLLNKMQLENLARAGAFDTLEKNRARVMTGAEVILRRAQAKAEERASSQIGLFGGGDARPEPLRLPEIPDWPELERLSHEAEAVGFHLSAHPLDTYKEALRKLGATSIALAQARAEAGVGRLKLAGTVVNSKERTTRTGSRMAWVRISDSSGSTEVTLFSEVLLRSREMLKEGNAILVTCEARMEGETLRLTAQDLEGLDKAAAGLRQMLRLTIDDIAAVEPIRTLLEREGPGKGKVALIPRTGPGQEIEVLLPGLFNVSPRMAQAMKVVPGVAHVEAG